MLSVFRFALLGAMCAVLTVPAASQEPKSASKNKKERDPNEVICENQEVLGSRLATKRICMTRAEWAEQRRSERALIDRSQVGSCVRRNSC